jgi:hypothetical protein
VRLSILRVTDLAELFADIDDAFEELRLSGADEIKRRRASRAVLSALYEVRELFHHALKAGYWAAVDASPAGEILEGLLVIRGRMTHGALDDIRPAVKPAYPGPKFYPSDYAYPGANLTWLELADMPADDRAELEHRDTKNRYATHVAGRMVLPTLDSARRFLRGLAPTI